MQTPNIMKEYQTKYKRLLEIGADGLKAINFLRVIMYLKYLSNFI